MISVLVVDDSAMMRRYLTRIFEEAGDFQVRTARNGEVALELLAEETPDVVTLDINMPAMDGLTCLSHIMTQKPCPVVMVSSLTEKGALSTLEALELGAVDYIAKPGGTVSHNMQTIAEELLAKVRAAASSRPRTRQCPVAAQFEEQPPVIQEASTEEAEGLVLVGVSTGGPSALESLLSGLSSQQSWPLVIAQHMPATFTGVLAKRLDGLCALPVREVNKPTPLLAGHVYMAQGDKDIEIRRRAGRLMAVPCPQDAKRPWHPSAERMVESAMEVLDAKQLVGLLLTGMGDDGAQAMYQLNQAGGRTLAESEDSCVVYGMPRALVELGGADEVLPVEDMPAQLKRWLPATTH
ncbi:two-component system, chemotaxis family, response regulator CheB [Marinospirillum celere]|uniref:Protein-glutamate methylesterase/protein-glutamine glutaminase n=1 Tax=Marinospirillum celere TaxID=1122252 RepID=A0A1I1FN44_9GAMM|nr:chemotaxis-specific protein-glutamate methyltransferase CheB [Marinospirillum celere]SFC00412.1 two-component system, chemotaxis family, response regulator CheB [Marinospirillum celere]